VPFILINGGGSIGTGWSSTIPPYNLEQIIEWIKAWLTSKPTPTLTPYYRGFKGTVKVEENKVVTEGIMSKDAKGRFVVSEIPIGKRMISINKYLSLLQASEDSGNIKNIDNQSTENEALFSFQVGKETFTPSAETMHLVDSTSMTNMVMFDKSGKLRKYDTVDEVMKEFCETRFEQYNKRKAGELKKMEYESMILYNKIRFIEMVITDKIKLLNKDEEALSSECKNLNFSLAHDKSFDYLLSIQIKQMTSKKIADLQKQYALMLAAINTLKNTSIAGMWYKELDELLVEYGKWVKLQK
jgi:DNA topoisomerase-2